jgi:hypothetical protein
VTKHDTELSQFQTCFKSNKANDTKMAANQLRVVHALVGFTQGAKKDVVELLLVSLKEPRTTLLTDKESTW